MKRLKRKSYSELKKELDETFSKYVRARDDYVCFTCGKKLTLQTSQAGHYISRGHLSLRWNEKNVHCQCRQCNILKKGNISEYAYNLVKVYSPSVLEELQAIKNSTEKYTRKDLEERIDYYKERLNCNHDYNP